MRRALIVAGICALVLAVVSWRAGWMSRPAAEPVRVGVLHSLSGPMASSERPVVEACLLAIDEINAAGGIDGRPVEVVVRDGRSDPMVFAREADALLGAERVAAIFGCWTSASRRAVRPVVERNGGLLLYPLQYEGMEESPRIVYLGAAPNQQVVPAVRWLLGEGKRRFAVIGSDYVFPRLASWVIRDVVADGGGTVTMEEFVPLSATDFGPIVERLRADPPDAILNLVNGEANAALFRALRGAGITSDRVPTMSFSVAEPEARAIGPSLLAGDLATWSYFQGRPGEANRRFVEAYRARAGEDAQASDPVAAAYEAVHHWATAARRAGSIDPDHVLQSLGNQSLHGPRGVTAIDPATQHTWQPVLIGRFDGTGQLRTVWESGRAVQPMPFPAWRSRRTWIDAVDALQRAWDGGWSNPDGRPTNRPSWPRGGRP
jgi:urea transport system substrate-binding protein